MKQAVVRIIPEPLYSQVLEIVLKITNASEADDSASRAAALLELQKLYEQLEASGSSDPFVTETLADYTEDDQQAAELYELAISQSASFSGEPTHTKKIALAIRRIDLSESIVARHLLVQAREEANTFGDDDSVIEADELLAPMLE